MDDSLVPNLPTIDYENLAARSLSLACNFSWVGCVSYMHIISDLSCYYNYILPTSYIMPPYWRHSPDDLARKFPAKQNKNISDRAVPQLKEYNLYPRLSAITFKTKERIAGIPILAGFPIAEETNLDNHMFLKTYHTNCLVIVRILTLLNCINVKTEKHASPAPDSKIQKARQRRGKLPLVSYLHPQDRFGKTD